MTDPVRLVEPSEFGREFLAELTAGGADVEALVAFLKGTVSCNYSGIASILQSPEARQAAYPLWEKGTPSGLATRAQHTARFFINEDTLAAGRTNYFMSGPAASGAPNLDPNTYSVACHPVWFNEFTPGAEQVFIATPGAAAQLGTAARGAAALSGSGRFKDFTLPTGTYRITFVGMLAGFPYYPGLTATLPSSSVYSFAPYGPSSDGALVNLPARPVDLLLQFGPGTMPATITLATLMFYPSDLGLARNRMLAGTVVVSVPQPTALKVLLQRRHARGTYTNTTDSSVRVESIGFNKSIISIPGSSYPTRDAYNYLDIMRIA